MFDAIRDNKRIAQVILGILIIPFAVFGLGSYFGDGLRSREIATVGGTSILESEFDSALQEQQQRLRLQKQPGEDATPDLLNSREWRQAVLDQLVARRALALYSRDMRLTVFGGQLQQALASVKDFQENGRFSLERYQASLAQMGLQGLTPAAFEARFAQDLSIQQLMDSIISSPPVARSSAHRLLMAELEERMVREMRFPVAPHLSNIKIDDAAIKKFYDDNPARFELPERVKAEYLVFGEVDIQRAYRDWPGERRVRHILIESSPESDAAARKEAEEIAVALRKEPDRFPALAREKSKDPGSSGAGGDLGYVAQDGEMEPSFEKAVFTLKQGEISDPVRTRYGFHIIQVTTIHKRPLDEVRDEIVAWRRKHEPVQGFEEKAARFSDMVFNEAPDSLQPAAEAFGMEIRRTDWIDRGTVVLGEFHNDRLVASLFEDDALKQHHNTQAINVGPDTLVSARVLEHEAARRVPFEDVRGRIEAQLRRAEAMRMAREEGNAVLAALDRGEAVNHAWGMPRSFQRANSFQRPSQDFPPEAAEAVFAASLEQLPTRVAAMLPDDAYVIYQIDSVMHPSIDDNDQRIAVMAKQYGLLLGQSDFESFLASLRDRYKVVTKPVTSKE
ncbi:MAG: SurA N-terminal domain-containing protein [Azoarcus sp.]|jgi:peptidyl-prolyl cis-trans isomerase D|nr:SurA N-terminal domain-containing protein [Azoarcus sp.]